MKYQRLQTANFVAATKIALILKKRKAISEREFAQIFADSKGIRPYCHGSFNKLMDTTKDFLIQHNVVSYHRINNLIIWVATQKCVRSKIENMFVEYQTVTNTNIDKAIAWQKVNAGMVPAEIEGKVIATNILGLTGKVVSEYTKLYTVVKPYIVASGLVDVKHAILTPVRALKEIKKV
jgi:hypothetical protein